jgi:hypothetical protein
MRNAIIFSAVTLAAFATAFACGDDDSGPVCPAARDCASRICGADPICMTSCGDCPSGQTCTAVGTCSTAPPNCPTDRDCTGRECGVDPVCMTSCGDCPAERPNCNASTGACTCTPNCTGRECGDDGCGGTCTPECPAGQTCTAGGVCLGGTGDACTITGECATGLLCSTNAFWCWKHCSTNADCVGVGLGGLNTTNGFTNYCVDPDGTGVCPSGVCECRPGCSGADSDCSAYGFNVCRLLWTATVSQYVCASPA